MKKQLLAAMLTALAGTTPVWADVTIEGGDGTTYPTINAAVAAATPDAAGAVTVIVDGEITETIESGTTLVNPYALNNNIKSLTVKGENNANIKFGGYFLFNVTNGVSLTLDNLKLTGNLREDQTAGRTPIICAKGSLYMTNVTIDNVHIDNGKNNMTMNNSAVIGLNSNSNAVNVVFDNVKIVNSTATAPGLVYATNSNIILKGDTELSIYLTGINGLKDAAEYTGNVQLVVDANRSGSFINSNGSAPVGAYFTVKKVGEDAVTIYRGVGTSALTPVNPESPLVNQTKNAAYGTLAAAINGANSGDVIVLYGDITITERTRNSSKSLTIKGATGNERIIRGEANTADNLLDVNATDQTTTIENLIIDGNNVEATAYTFEPANTCSLVLNNVKIINSTTSVARGLISNNTNNPGTWHLNGVEFENCSASTNTQLVTSAAEGNTISGCDLGLSIKITGDNFITVEGELTNPREDLIHIFVLTPGEGKKVIAGYKGDTTKSPAEMNQHFLCVNAQDNSEEGDIEWHLEYDEPTDCFVYQRGWVSGVEDIVTEADTEAPVLWYNLSGMPVDQPGEAGIYIRRQGNKVSKVLVK